MKVEGGGGTITASVPVAGLPENEFPCKISLSIAVAYQPISTNNFEAFLNKLVFPYEFVFESISNEAESD